MLKEDAQAQWLRERERGAASMVGNCPILTLSVSHYTMREMELHNRDNLLKIHTVKNEGRCLQWVDYKFYANRS